MLSCVLFTGVFCLSDLVIFWPSSLSHQQYHYGHKEKPASIGQTFLTSYSVSLLWCSVTNSVGFTQLGPPRFSFLLWERKRMTGWMQHWVKVGGCYLSFDRGTKWVCWRPVHAFVCHGGSQGGYYLVQISVHTSWRVAAACAVGLRKRGDVWMSNKVR